MSKETLERNQQHEMGYVDKSLKPSKYVIFLWDYFAYLGLDRIPIMKFTSKECVLDLYF